MKVILLQDIAKVGKKYDIVSVADGYAFNYLIPKHLAETATEEKEREVASLREKAQAENEQRVTDIEQKSAALKESPVVIEAKANENGVLFAGIEKSHIQKALSTEHGIEVSEDEIELKGALKEVGEHSVPLSVGEKQIDIPLSIKAEE